MDWNAIGADVIQRLTPVIVLVLTYYARNFIASLSPLATNIVTAVLVAAMQGVDVLVSGGQFNVVQTAILTALSIALHELLSNTGLKPTVKKLLLIRK